MYQEHDADTQDWAATSFVVHVINDSMCGTYSPRILEELARRNIITLEVTGYDDSSCYYVYAALNTVDGLYVLNPAIGQYSDGFRGIYAAPLEELRSFVTSSDTLLHYEPESREEFQSSRWGFSIGTAFRARQYQYAQLS